MSFRTSMIAAGLVAGLAAVTPVARAGGSSSIFSTGSVFGEVRNNTGVLEMGATVYLYNRYDQLIRQALTNPDGKFVFDGLIPDTYSLRVVLTSFLPALRKNIAVAPGSENLLRVNLGTIFSGIDVAPPADSQGALMSDEWKWVLRTSAATRPVLRLTPVSSSGGGSHHHLGTTFTDTTGLVRLSAGESGPLAGSGAQAFGTTFAVSTRVKGASEVRVSGNFGYIASSGLPITALRSTYSRQQDSQQGPQMSVTVHQIYFPGLGPQADAGYSGEAGPAMRTMTLSAADKLQINDQLELEYETHLDAVAFGHVQGRLSPFLRATYDLGTDGALRVAYNSGTAPSEIMNRDSLRGDETALPELDQDLAALAMLPVISRDAGGVRMERSRNFEAGYQLTQGARKFYASVYDQSVYDSVFDMSAPPVFSSHADLLPALDGNYFLFDLGNYRRMGYSFAMSQGLGAYLSFTVGAGRSGDLLPGNSQISGNTAGDVRGEIRTAQRSFVMAKANATLPGLGTRFAVSYGWTESGALMPTHFSLTTPVNQEQGLNIGLHQPLPRLGGLGGRMEAAVELRNAMAQGYLPVTAAGHCGIITDAPRSLRGGLSFLF